MIRMTSSKLRYVSRRGEGRRRRRRREGCAPNAGATITSTQRPDHADKPSWNAARFTGVINHHRLRYPAIPTTSRHLENTGHHDATGGGFGMLPFCSRYDEDGDTTYMGYQLRDSHLGTLRVLYGTMTRLGTIRTTSSVLPTPWSRSAGIAKLIKLTRCPALMVLGYGAVGAFQTVVYYAVYMNTKVFVRERLASLAFHYPYAGALSFPTS
ncbi:hypothetical protein Hypma_013969 [Hypsizygus marmoreus]|uniref:Uncharacterized protein n=1 Tax=Hypsizygus marmoreus TaxID=39966 RepID=A0A369K8D1_HYPMA|nr:hypothetical protein Hypma_013969 [Hypsizygus marmoreus]